MFHDEPCFDRDYNLDGRHVGKWVIKIFSTYRISIVFVCKVRCEKATNHSTIAHVQSSKNVRSIWRLSLWSCWLVLWLKYLHSIFILIRPNGPLEEVNKNLPNLKNMRWCNNPVSWAHPAMTIQAKSVGSTHKKRHKFVWPWRRPQKHFIHLYVFLFSFSFF